MEEFKREKTLEELKKEYADAQNKYNTLKETIKKREAEEAKKKEAALASEKAARRKEIEDKMRELGKLEKAYVNDYGCYSYSSESDPFSYLWHLFF